MVIKAKSEQPVKLLRNMKNYRAWSVPSINASSGKLFRQNIQDEAEIEQSEEVINAQAIQSIKDHAFTEGFEKGRREGLDSAQQEIEQKSKLLKEITNGLSNPLQDCQQKTQQALLELAFAVARQIVRRELKQDPTQLIAIIRQALKQMPIASKNIKILLHPDDASIVREVLSIDKNQPDSPWQLVEEPSMERGGCLVNSDNSKIDASVDNQIAILFSRIAGGQRSGENEHGLL